MSESRFGVEAPFRAISPLSSGQGGVAYLRRHILKCLTWLWHDPLELLLEHTPNLRAGVSTIDQQVRVADVSREQRSGLSRDLPRDGKRLPVQGLEEILLADDAEFQKKRAQMYQWQEGIIQAGISDAKALQEMAQYIEEYNLATKRAVRKVYTKFAFTLIPIAITAVAGPLALAAGDGAIANLVKFWIYDRKPVVEAGESQAAAMLHTIHEELGWQVPTLGG